jgi:phosphonatase-like hydrolase
MPQSSHVASAQLVVFDVAGTTVSDGDIVIDAVDQALKEGGVHADRHAIRALMGVPKPVAIRTLLERHRDGIADLDASATKIHETFLARALERYRHAAELREMDGAAAVFAALRQRHVKVALDTGFSRPILDVLLDRLGWTAPGTIDCSVTSDEVPHGRPAADLIRRAMHLTGVVDPQTVAKVGDTPVDIQSGRAAGCGWVVGVAFGTHSRAELEPHRPDAVIDRLADLVSLLQLR